MVYKAIGVMGGSSLKGLDIIYTHLQETGGKWSFEILHAGYFSYPEHWTEQLRNAASLTALDYQLLHAAYGQYTGEQVNLFIEDHALAHKVDLIASQGHTIFHVPSGKMTAQLGDGAAIAAAARLPVVTDFRSLDIALGGRGAPILPIGERLLLPDYDLFLQLGETANISANNQDGYKIFDICPANQVLNILANGAGGDYHEIGTMASNGEVDEKLLHALNGFAYHGEDYPKLSANDFNIDAVLTLIHNYRLTVYDALRTYIQHIAVQVKKAAEVIVKAMEFRSTSFNGHQLLLTGGGAFNVFLVKCIEEQLKKLKVEVIVPEKNIINFKEVLITALLGVLRWREEYNVLATVTGASRSSIGGALWLGGEA